MAKLLHKLVTPSFAMLSDNCLIASWSLWPTHDQVSMFLVSVHPPPRLRVCFVGGRYYHRCSAVGWSDFQDRNLHLSCCAKCFRTPIPKFKCLMLPFNLSLGRASVLKVHHFLPKPFRIHQKFAEKAGGNILLLPCLFAKSVIQISRSNGFLYLTGPDPSHCKLELTLGPLITWQEDIC